MKPNNATDSKKVIERERRTKLRAEAKLLAQEEVKNYEGNPMELLQVILTNRIYRKMLRQPKCTVIPKGNIDLFGQEFQEDYIIHS